MVAVSEAQKRASKNWDEKNRERKNYIIKRSTAKNFILKLATKEDIEMLKDCIIEREKQL